MELVCLSISHHNAPLELRESLSLGSEELESALLHTPIRSGSFAALLELAVLSTCNRFELYALIGTPDSASAGQETGYRTLLTYVDQVFEIPPAQVEQHFNRFGGSEAARHLFLVAAGLDSIAIGETQILGQVSRALESALRLGGARHVLSSLFRAAIHAGKRAHSETEIGRHPTSIAAIAVQLAECRLGSLAEQAVLVIGAGKMGASTLEALAAAGARQVSLSNRTLQHAEELAMRVGGVVLPYEQLSRGLAEADVVFTATSASQTVIDRQATAAILAGRPGRPLTLVDLAVPRNIEPAVRELAGVRLYDMDDLQAWVKGADLSRSLDLAIARQIIASEVAEFEALLRVMPFLGELHKKAEEIRQHEVEKTLRHLRTADRQVQEQIEMLSRALVRKILHEPTMHLRSETDQQTLQEYVGTLTRLFDLGETEIGLSLPMDRK